MRVFLRPTGLHSRAMTRVANALAQYAPPSVTLAGSPAPSSYCDLQILHVISYDAIDYAAQILARGGRYAVIQYCLGHPTEILWDAWRKLWAGAGLVWSYYPLHEHTSDLGVPFYYAPLGVDEVFRACIPYKGRTLSRFPRIITSGYVTGPRAEPILEVWKAAELAGIGAIHLGPWQVEGMTRDNTPRNWDAVQNVSDVELAKLYATSTWVSGLRHVEGFELPAAEGLVCGARPIVFDQPSMREWYGEHAVYVREREQSGPDSTSLLCKNLVEEIACCLARTPPPVTPEERERVMERFSWETIAKGFWEALLR